MIHEEHLVFLGDNLCTLMTTVTVDEMQNLHHDATSPEQKPYREQGVGAEKNKQDPAHSPSQLAAVFNNVRLPRLRK